MATLWMEPGGDASFDTATTLTAFTPASATLASPFGTLNVVTDFVHGAHVKSLQAPAIGVNGLEVRTLGDTGRTSVYFYLTALPAGTANLLKFTNSAASVVFRLRITSAGVLQLWEATAQIGSNGSTLSTGVWYRLSVCWNLTSTSVNELRVYKDGGTADISVSNATLTRVGTTRCRIGNSDADTLDCRLSDMYFDDSSSPNDVATDLWVTAKRPNANGSVNGFTTQVGSGGSGYGSGHSPQVNERPSSLTNGWSMVGAGSAVTEEYSVEPAATGDIDISGAAIIDYMGWVFAKSVAAETAQIVVGGTATNISLPFSTQQTFMQAKGSTSYPAGGTDIGIITATDLTTVSLYECGLMVAYTPVTGQPQVKRFGGTQFVGINLPSMGINRWSRRGSSILTPQRLFGKVA